ncbi:hypothetical protein ACFLQ1_02855, partial [Candidatus Auribacterota bacterium]
MKSIKKVFIQVLLPLFLLPGLLLQPINFSLSSFFLSPKTIFTPQPYNMTTPIENVILSKEDMGILQKAKERLRDLILNKDNREIATLQTKILDDLINQGLSTKFAKSEKKNSNNSAALFVSTESLSKFNHWIKKIRLRWLFWRFSSGHYVPSPGPVKTWWQKTALVFIALSTTVVVSCATIIKKKQPFLKPGILSPKYKYAEKYLNQVQPDIFEELPARKQHLILQVLFSLCEQGEAKIFEVLLKLGQADEFSDFSE